MTKEEIWERLETEFKLRGYSQKSILIASLIKFLILGSVIISMLSIFLFLPCNHQFNDGKQLPIILSWNQLRKGLSV